MSQPAEPKAGPSSTPNQNERNSDSDPSKCVLNKVADIISQRNFDCPPDIVKLITKPVDPRKGIKCIYLDDFEIISSKKTEKKQTEEVAVAPKQEQESKEPDLQPDDELDYVEVETAAELEAQAKLQRELKLKRKEHEKLLTKITDYVDKKTRKIQLRMEYEERTQGLGKEGRMPLRQLIGEKKKDPEWAEGHIRRKAKADHFENMYDIQYEKLEVQLMKVDVAYSLVPVAYRQLAPPQESLENNDNGNLDETPKEDQIIFKTGPDVEETFTQLNVDDKKKLEELSTKTNRLK